MTTGEWVDKYFDPTAGILAQTTIIPSVCLLTFWFSLWCVGYVGMGDNWFLLLLNVAVTVSFIAAMIFVFAMVVCLFIKSLAGWISLLGGVFASLLVLELVQIWPKVYDRIDGNINPSHWDLLVIMILLSPVVLLAIAFLSTRRHEQYLARLRNIPLTSKYAWSQDDG